MRYVLVSFNTKCLLSCKITHFRVKDYFSDVTMKASMVHAFSHFKICLHFVTVFKDECNFLHFMHNDVLCTRSSMYIIQRYIKNTSLQQLKLRHQDILRIVIEESFNKNKT